jgi:hypothetical protein
VETAMKHPEKLIHRTQQLRGTPVKIIGKPQDSQGENPVADPVDPEIFDDTLFYQQLLKSLIERDSSDPAGLMITIHFLLMWFYR